MGHKEETPQIKKKDNFRGWEFEKIGGICMFLEQLYISIQGKQWIL